MKKTFAYATIAALFGVAIMLAPFLIINIPTSIPNSTGEGDTYRSTTLPTQSLVPANTQAAAKLSESSAGVVPNYPVDAVTVMLMLLFSLAVAFAVVFYFKRYRFLKSEKMLLPT
jgi:hypothetical protein